MAEVTLGDYTAYVFLQMVKAREMADAYSRSVAERYAEDPVMRHFSAPRFRVPKMQLTIPVLVSGAQFSQSVRFDFPVEEFVASIGSRANDVRRTVLMSRVGTLPRLSISQSGSVDALARDFHQQLTANRDLLRPDTIVATMWGRIFRQCLGEARLMQYYEQTDPGHELLDRTTGEVLDMVRGRTVVDKTALESLLVTPETNDVKHGSSESSVFTVSAELVEEGFYLRTVQEEGQEPRTVVDFE